MITKEEFLAYENVRAKGRWNMFTEARLAAADAGLSFQKYTEILFNYSDLAKKYLAK